MIDLVDFASHDIRDKSLVCSQVGFLLDPCLQYLAETESVKASIGNHQNERGITHEHPHD